MDTLWRVIERNARNFPNQTALRYPPQNLTLTWQSLHSQALGLASTIQSLEIGIERIALLSPNKPEFVLGFLAAMVLDKAIVPINIRLSVREISNILTDGVISVLLYEESMALMAQELEQLGFTIINITTESAAGEDISSPHCDGTKAAEILYTSGTTGKPKGVMLSHQAILAAAKIMAYEAEIYAADNCLILMPLTHSAPLNLFLWGAFWAGASVTLGDFTPQTLLDYAAQEKTTHFFGAPVVYQLVSMIPNLGDWDLSIMKVWVYGGASVGAEAIVHWQTVLPGKWMGVYGLTEAGPNGTALRPQEHGGKTGSIGRRGTANTEIRVVRADNTDTDPDEAGEIILRSESLMAGYLNNPAATREALHSGWLYTGDIARRDKDGYIWILDRKKDMIITGGVNVYPKEIEDILSTHPAILELAVIGIPHKDWGESILAKLVLNPGETITLTDLKNYCRDKLADYKIPHCLSIVDSLPRNASGKILKHVLRAEYNP
ncbi:acyl-CoA synthetase (AMP-forming)/AMP-acid ligase II [Desulfosporosinus orientis DSM 765]|uniref:Acyl-CoA synthetase (AMP-forming)/AMP-acid ligase II n=1 Tax=Desulfosporosinus orientis (strain ATCC 19365 / DSM 765 / NCIMB 8382 / VKM B-1628 / Singapore I) TaxID=768706 RepID=G7WAS5_DESOD|nr:AMP-binding protein [Desulfosporosinus orientis]AET67136.1 acyl-CoA synthetase (AMP-forming)/AMP-acid ligase II [Desulfosporosinus orientis DSM 765]